MTIEQPDKDLTNLQSGKTKKEQGEVATPEWQKLKEMAGNDPEKLKKLQELWFWLASFQTLPYEELEKGRKIIFGDSTE